MRQDLLPNALRTLWINVQATVHAKGWHAAVVRVVTNRALRFGIINVFLPTVLMNNGLAAPQLTRVQLLLASCAQSLLVWCLLLLLLPLLEARLTFRLEQLFQ